MAPTGVKMYMCVLVCVIFFKRRLLKSSGELTKQACNQAHKQTSTQANMHASKHLDARGHSF